MAGKHHTDLHRERAKRRFVIMVENKNTEIGKSQDQKSKPQITKLENYKVEDRNQRLDDVLKSLAE